MHKNNHCAYTEALDPRPPELYISMVIGNSLGIWKKETLYLLTRPVYDHRNQIGLYIQGDHV